MQLSADKQQRTTLVAPGETATQLLFTLLVGTFFGIVLVT